MKFALKFTETSPRQNRDDLRPGNFRLPAVQGVLEKLIQVEHLEQFQPQPDIAKPTSSFGPDACDIDLNLLRGAVLKKGCLVTRMTLGHVLEAEASGFIHLSPISHGPVTWPPRRPIGFQQHPVVIGFAVFVPADFSDEHIKLYLTASILFKKDGLHSMAFLRKRRTNQAEKEVYPAKML